MLSEQGWAEHGQPCGGILEHPQDGFEVRDGECEDFGFAVVACLEFFCGVVESGVSELPASVRTVSSSTGMPASIEAPRVGLEPTTLRLTAECSAN